MKPLAAFSMAWGANMMAFFAVRFTSAHIPGIPDLQAQWGGAVADAEAISVLGVVVALLILLFREQQQNARERAILAGEMQAAGDIQRMLAPAAIQSAPGLSIQVAFHAMRDVGGDFYLCRVLPDGRQRVLLGDVSGKGTAAAMTATLLLGGASARESDSPAALLRHLNLVLSDMHVGGFATCFCADISPNGCLTIANGGHLAPYRNGEEIAVENGLPLGILATSAYNESAFELTPGDTLTFLSDGVVEARNSAGELFGFDRTRKLSSKPAEEIAQAAQAFGQEDDITVLTLTFSPVAVLHA
jgi:serine phosphatase RsbU (regulator of sigma subunit)